MLRLALIGAPLGAYGRDHEHRDLPGARPGARRRRAAGTSGQRPAGVGVPVVLRRAHQLRADAVGDADVRRRGRRRERGGRAGDRRAPAGHRGRRAGRGPADEAVPVPDAAGGRGGPDGDTGPGAAGRRPAARHRGGQPRPGVRLRAVHRGHGHAHGPAAASGAARRGTGPVRGGGLPAQRRRPAGGRLARSSLWLRRGRAADRRDRARPGSGVPLAARHGRPPHYGRSRRDQAARGPAAGRRAAAGPDLRRDHGGGRRGGLLPPAGGRRHRPASRPWACSCRP